MENWPEVESALKLGRREIVAKGPGPGGDASRPRDELPPELFLGDKLTLISISGTGVDRVGSEVASLVALRELLLFSNRIVTVDPATSALRALRVLDLSRNRIAEAPPELDRLPELASLNLSDNAILKLPAYRFPALRELDLSRNKLEEIDPICSAGNPRLAELKFASNKIRKVPAELVELPSLKTLDLTDNLIETIPGELGSASKLKDLELKGNKISDNRLMKLVNQCRPKQILDYVRQNCPKGGSETEAGRGAKGGGPAAGRDPPPSEPLHDRIIVAKCEDDTPNVKSDERVKTVRAHAVCCIVRGLNFTEDTFKKFIQMQTKLHDGICEKRNAATIATHDLDKIPPGDLLYTARPPYSVNIRPLMREKTYSGLELYARLRKEADDLRKEKKRNVYSGIHKYLYLLEGKSLYPCLEDSQGNVISFPPITNSDLTKMSHETKNALIEVTSSLNQTTCRKVMDQFLLETLNSGVGGDVREDEPENRLGVARKLLVQQMKIVDLEGKMRVIYPSKVDLQYEDKKMLKIIRE